MEHITFIVLITVSTNPMTVTYLDAFAIIALIAYETVGGSETVQRDTLFVDTLVCWSI